MAGKAAVSSSPRASLQCGWGSRTVGWRGVKSRCPNRQEMKPVDLLSPGPESGTALHLSYSLGQAVPESRFQSQGLDPPVHGKSIN